MTGIGIDRLGGAVYERKGIIATMLMLGNLDLLDVVAVAPSESATGELRELHGQ